MKAAGLNEIEALRLDALLSRADALNSKIRLAFADQMADLDTRSADLRVEVAERMEIPEASVRIDLEEGRIVILRPGANTEDAPPAPAADAAAQRASRFSRKG